MERSENINRLDITKPIILHLHLPENTNLKERIELVNTFISYYKKVNEQLETRKTLHRAVITLYDQTVLGDKIGHDSLIILPDNNLLVRDQISSGYEHNISSFPSHFTTPLESISTIEYKIYLS